MQSNPIPTVVCIRLPEVQLFRMRRFVCFASHSTSFTLSPYKEALVVVVVLVACRIKVAFPDAAAALWDRKLLWLVKI